MAAWGTTAVLDVAYRVLGVVVQARYQLAFVLAVLNTLFVLFELRVFLDEPSAANLLALLDAPLILALAAYLLAQLPPGVVFRRAAMAAANIGDSEPLKLPRGCRASARFRVGETWEWRLFAPCTLAVGGAGQIELLVPSPGPRPRPRRVAARRPGPGEWQWSAGPRVPLWTADPALIQRLARERNERDQAPLGPIRLSIPRFSLAAVVAGWQYLGLRRYAALRLTFRDGDGAEQLGYLAFDTPAVCAAVAARLG